MLAQHGLRLRAGPAGPSSRRCRAAHARTRVPLAAAPTSAPAAQQQQQQQQLLLLPPPQATAADGEPAPGLPAHRAQHNHTAQSSALPFPHGSGHQPPQPRPALVRLAALTSADSWDLDDECGGLPAPANLPVEHDADDDVLYPPRQLLTSWASTSNPGIDLLLAGPAALEHLQVHVILFGVGERDTEGIYSLRAFGDDGLPQETIIVFEGEEDAQRYAGLLEATMDHTPHVCSIPPRELLDFCVDQGYNCRMEPCGSLLIPPDFNVGVTDWERSMRLRDGRWEVLAAEPVRSSSSSSLSHLTASTLNSAASVADALQQGQAAAEQPPPQPQLMPNAQQLPPHMRPGTPAVAANATSLARYHPSFSSSQLQHVREQLEALLPSQEGSGAEHMEK